MKLAVLLTIVASTASAVEPGKPSVTALLAAVNRAVGARNPDASMRNPDYLAEKFLGPEERAILEHASPRLLRALSMDFEDAAREVAWVPSGVATTRFFDAMLLDAVNGGARQVVNLGAGLDSRAYRFQEHLSGVKVFELDFGPTQEYKKQRVREILGTLRGNVIYVPIDFTKEDMGTVLRRAGYHPEIKTFYIWEAVTMYLSEEAVSATLRAVARNSAPGSTIAFEYSASATHDADRAKRFATYGEPLLFGFPAARAKQFLSEQGLTMGLDLGPDEMTSRYLTRPDGSVYGGTRAARYCTAVVPEKGR
jgi:methyltransferase (TIGR00027 family)